MSHPRSTMSDWSAERLRSVRARQGTPLPGVEIRVVDDTGTPLPWDGTSIGELEVRGPWIATSYYEDARSADAFHDGWFRPATW